MESKAGCIPEQSQPVPRRAARLLHPLAGSNPRNYWHQLAGHDNYSRRSLLPLMISTGAMSIRSVFSAIEALQWRRAIKTHALRFPPVFIIGHWGSGTTYLHELISKDPQFGFLEFAHALTPWNMLGSNAILRLCVRPFIPRNRPFDRVAISLKSPQEEEMALANMNPISFFNTIYFPRQIERHTRQSLFLDSVTDAERVLFEKSYRLLALQLSIRRGGKRLLFKNPASTTRVPLLRKIFPGAKFIHIVRNPLEVYASAINRLPWLFSEFALQDSPDFDLDSYVFDTYEQVMRCYLRDRDSIPAGDLFETRFERIVQDPLNELEKAYDALNLPNSALALSAVKRHLENCSPYQRSPRPLAPAQIEAVLQKWKFAFEFWDYSTVSDFGGIRISE